MDYPRAPAAGEEVLATVWGPQVAAAAGHNDYIPILLGGMQGGLAKFLTMGTRQRLWLILSFLLLVGAWLLWPILFSLRVDGTTSMSWAVVWIPLWIIDAIGLVFFLVLVSWGTLKAPPGREQDWQDPYPVSMRLLALAEWTLLILFQVFLVLQLDDHISWTWERVLSPLLAWVCIRAVGDSYKLVFLQRERLFLGRVIQAMKLAFETFFLLLQILFIMWRLDKEVSWNWWIVFFPTWVLHIGQAFIWCFNQAVATCFMRRIEGGDNSSVHAQRSILEAALLTENSKMSRQLLGGTVVVTILAVNLIAGADYSTFVVFIPQFLSAAYIVAVVSCLVCCVRGHPEDYDTRAVEYQHQPGV